MGFVDARLECTYLYVRHLQRVLPRERSESLDLGSSLALTHLRFQEGAETDVGLDEGGDAMAAETGETTVVEPARDPLSRIIHDLNERHGLQLGAGDEVVRRMTEALVDDPELQEAAAANSFQNFALLFDEKFEQQAIDARNQSWEFFEQAFGDAEIRAQLEDALAREVYGRLSGESQSGAASLTSRERLAVERLAGLLDERLGDRLMSVWLYGSRARGERPHPESDVDVMVVTTDADRDRDLVSELSWATAESEGVNPFSLSVHVVDPAWVEGRRGIRSFFMQEVDRDKVVLAGVP
ncbi:MAG: nucleotidyltransferase domain-containing protein [Solirubrobacterales bacterium]